MPLLLLPSAQEVLLRRFRSLCHYEARCHLISVVLSGTLNSCIVRRSSIPNAPCVVVYTRFDPVSVAKCVMQVTCSPARSSRCSRTVDNLPYLGNVLFAVTCTRTTCKLPSSPALAKQCKASSIQTALTRAWCWVYVCRGLLVTFRSRRAVSQILTVLSSEAEAR